MTSPDEKTPDPYFPPLTGMKACVPPGTQYRWSWTFTERLTFQGVHGLTGAVQVRGLIVGCLHILPTPGLFLPDSDFFYVRPFTVEANEPMCLDLWNSSAEPLELEPALIRADKPWTHDGRSA